MINAGRVIKVEYEKPPSQGNGGEISFVNRTGFDPASRVTPLVRPRKGLKKGATSANSSQGLPKLYSDQLM